MNYLVKVVCKTPWLMAIVSLKSIKNIPPIRDDLTASYMSQVRLK